MLLTLIETVNQFKDRLDSHWRRRLYGRQRTTIKLKVGPTSVRSQNTSTVGEDFDKKIGFTG